MSGFDLPHLAGLLFGRPLLIARPKLDTVLAVLTPRLLGTEVLGPPASEPAPRSYAVTPDGIAVVPVVGTLVNRSFGLAALSGLTSYQDLTAQLADAAADPAVRGVLLDVDSAGGEAGGVFDCADQVLALRAVKPVYAVAGDSCFSAAYAIACAVDRLFVTRTAGAGSIGVVALHLDQSGADAQAGLRYAYLYAGGHKIDGNPHAPLTDQARTALQAEVDRLYGLFVAHVARCRGLSEAQVRAQEAALVFGADAVTAGLADAVGTRAAALAALTRRLSGAGSRSSSLSLPKGPRMSDPVLEPTTASAAADEATLRAQLAAEVAARTVPVVPAEDPAALEARLRAEAAEIFDLCQLAGQPAAAAGFIRDGSHPAAVRQALLIERARAYEATVVIPVDTGAGAAADHPLIAAIKAQYAPVRKG